MRIGIDFDNTIVNYDSLFHKVACAEKLIPADTPASKFAVRDYLVRTDQEDRWTLMQGLVYGRRMDEASIFKGVIEFFNWAKVQSHQIAIISHKTRYPYKGTKYDLHAAARDWIKHHLNGGEDTLIPGSHVYFELTKEKKILRIADFRCDVFIDDLPDILLNQNFPSQTRRVLFDPDGHHAEKVSRDFHICHSWEHIFEYFKR